MHQICTEGDERRAMGGDLTVERVYGAGATFTIVLPRVQKTQPESGP